MYLHLKRNFLSKFINKTFRLIQAETHCLQAVEGAL